MSNKFEKFLFSTFLNDRGVAKYIDEKGRITLKVEHASRGVFQGPPIFFENNNEYEQWIDNIVDEVKITVDHSKVTDQHIIESSSIRHLKEIKRKNYLELY